MATYDAIVIGTGQAGPALTRRLAGAGMKVAIIERGRFGGTCVNTGCTPTKTLVASAYAAHLARRGADYGFSAGEVKVDMQRVKARKDQIVGRSTRGVERSLKNLENCQVCEGHARLKSAPRYWMQIASSSMSVPGHRCLKFLAWTRSTTSPTAR
jgi:pyruvate/2-oxoglutarate dehydrogenase complex dihydrolipoamide dehydrogenase (E3) component